MIKRILLILAALAGICVAQPTYNATSLSIPGYSSVNIQWLSNDGSVGVGYANSAAGAKCFIYRGGNFSLISTPGFSCFAFQGNVKGDLVGYLYDWASSQNPPTQLFLYVNATSTFTPLTVPGFDGTGLPPGFIALGNDDTVYGNYSFSGTQTFSFGTEQVTLTQPFAISPMGQFTQLLNLGGSSAAISGMDSNGDLVGSSDISGVVAPAVGDVAMWPKAGGIVDLTASTGFPLLTGVISSNGTVAGVMTNNSVAGAVEGYVLSGGVVTPFQAFGSTLMSVFSVNSSGQVVGDYTPPNGFGRPYLYSDGEVYDLTSLVQNLPSGVVLTSAGVIDDAGQIFVFGTPNGAPTTGQSAQTFLLTPAEDPAAQSGGGVRRRPRH
jgi:hypothetical protein